MRVPCRRHTSFKQWLARQQKLTGLFHRRSHALGLQVDGYAITRRVIDLLRHGPHFMARLENGLRSCGVLPRPGLVDFQPETFGALPESHQLDFDRARTGCSSVEKWFGIAGKECC